MYSISFYDAPHERAASPGMLLPLGMLSPPEHAASSGMLLPLDNGHSVSPCACMLLPLDMLCPPENAASQDMMLSLVHAVQYSPENPASPSMLHAPTGMLLPLDMKLLLGHAALRWTCC